MISRFEETDFSILGQDGLDVLVNELVELPEKEIEDELTYLIDNKIKLDAEVPKMLQKLFHNEKISTILEKIGNEPNS